ncbi:MAG TPA: hypothetical protein VK928_10885, partial [Longimicrobiales bacterium]|nr:hypothetical protein [Longimicrobiales bacterium]
MKFARVILASAALTLPVAALSRAPWTPPGADTATLRFSWRMSVKAQENCRARTQEELDALPVHMRTPEVCTRDDAAYVLVTRIDDTTPDTVHLLRGGVKGDRPLFVLEERVLPPGVHRVGVELQRITTEGAESMAALDTELELRPGGIALVTLDAADRLV